LLRQRALGLNDVTVVGHSTGGGEVARDMGRDGTSRVCKIVQISAVPPGLLKTSANPEGLPSQAFDGLRAGLVGTSIPTCASYRTHTRPTRRRTEERTPLPGDDASLAMTRHEDWLGRSTAQQQRTLSVKGA
jgi:pimeloyl-ACP methyl ester carboxylesterase